MEVLFQTSSPSIGLKIKIENFKNVTNYNNDFMKLLHLNITFDVQIICVSLN